MSLPDVQLALCLLPDLLKHYCLVTNRHIPLLHQSHYVMNQNCRSHLSSFFTNGFICEEDPFIIGIERSLIESCGVEEL